MSSTCSHNMANFGPLTAEICSGVCGTPANFEQRVSRLASVTAATSLNGPQPNYARYLAASCAGTLYLHFRGLLPLREFCQVQSSLYVQVLRSPILAALVHGTRVVGISQTLRRRTRNGITELSHGAPSIFGRAAITLGTGPHSSLILFLTVQKRHSA